MRKIRDKSAAKLAVMTMALGAGLGVAALGPATARSASTEPAALIGGQTIAENQTLYSDDGHYALTMQGDGNLVEYNTDGAPQNNVGQSTVGLGRAVWDSATSGEGNQAVLEPDGDLVVLSPQGQQLWSNNKSFSTSQGCPALTIGDDGNLSEYVDGSLVWDTDIIPSTLQSGDVLKSNQRLWAANEQFALYMQGDGNLVLYNTNFGAAWDSQTRGYSGAYAVMETDGDLVVNDASGNELWSSETANNPGAVAWLGGDGNFTIYPAGQSPGNGTALFQTGAANPGNGDLSPQANPGTGSACPPPAATTTTSAGSTGAGGTSTSSSDTTTTTVSPGVTVATHTPTTAQVTVTPPSKHSRTPALRVKLSFDWVWNNDRTALHNLEVGREPSGTRWRVSIRTASKPKPRTTTRTATTTRAKASLIHWLETFHFVTGDVLYFELTRKGDSPEAAQFTMRRRARPAIKANLR